MNDTEQTATTPEPAEPDSPRFGAGARTLMVIAAVLVVGAGYLAISSGGDDASETPMPASPWEGAEKVEASEVSGLAEEVGHGVYWAGERSGKPVGVSTDEGGNVHVRYLPADADPANPAPAYFDVGSYPFGGAYAATAALARDTGNVPVKVPGAAAFYPESRPTSVILSFRKDPDVQVEVFHPEPKKALAYVKSGAIVPVP